MAILPQPPIAGQPYNAFDILGADPAKAAT